MSHIAKKARQNGGGRAAIARPHSTANEDAVVAEDGKGSKKVMTSDDKPESVPFKRYHGAKLMMGGTLCSPSWSSRRRRRKSAACA